MPSTGLIFATCGTFSNALASSTVSDCAEVAVPGKITSVLVPSAARFWLSNVVAPCVSMTTAITAATPITTPRVVNNERRRLTHRASRALPKFAPNIRPRLKRARTFCRRGVTAGVSFVGCVCSFVELLMAATLLNPLTLLALLRTFHLRNLWGLPCLPGG